MKKIICILICVLSLTLTGCSYERDEEPGQVVNITVDQMQKKIEKKESFAIVFTQITCSACQDLHAMLESYLLDHNITLYEVVLDEAPKENRKKELKSIQTIFKGMDETPSLYYVKDGKNDDQVLSSPDKINETRFDNFVQKHRLDEKK